MTDFNRAPGIPQEPDPWPGFDPSIGGDGKNWEGSLSKHSRQFDAGVNDLKARMNEALDNLQKNPSNAAALSDYQAALSEYNMYRMLQSNSSKNLADMMKGNIRNLT